MMRNFMLGRVFVNPKKKTFVLLNLTEEDYIIKVKCDNEDKFDYQIGLGILISKWVAKANVGMPILDKYKFAREKLSKRVDGKRQLNFRKYSEWVLLNYFHCDLEHIDRIMKQLREEGEATI